MWAVEFGEIPTVQAAGPGNWSACRKFAERYRTCADGKTAPSALYPGGARGRRADGSLQLGSERDSKFIALFRLRPELVGNYRRSPGQLPAGIRPTLLAASCRFAMICLYMMSLFQIGCILVTCFSSSIRRPCASGLNRTPDPEYLLFSCHAESTVPHNGRGRAAAGTPGVTCNIRAFRKRPETAGVETLTPSRR